MITPPRRLWAWALAIVFLIAHLLFLPSTLEDLDSLNFALGLHDFDPIRHQPHPPGYPVFIALGRIARAVVPSDATALALVGAILGSLAVFPLMTLLERIESLRRGAGERSGALSVKLATVLVVASPLYWFNGLRPLSDVPGLAFSLAAQAALATAFVRQRLNPLRTPEALAASGQMIVLGAFLAAVAIGVRSQALWLTLPLLVVVLLQRAGRGAAGALLGSAMTFSIGALLWAVPLVIASGGLAAYRVALNAQGGEDFSGVDMLYRHPGARRLAVGLYQTFIDPWASPALGWTVFGLAAVGAYTLLRRAPRAALLVGVLIVPYGVFHLLFHETVTTRYALPFIPFIAYLAVLGLQLLPTRVATAAVAALVVWSLVLTLPAVRIYARDGSPAFAALRDLHAALESAPAAAIGMHQGLARSVQTQDFGQAQLLAAPPMREWLELGKYWRGGGSAPVWFLADPARTDIELIDPLSRTVRSHYVWSFPRERFLGGVRPDIVDLVRMDSPPGWFAEEGWHLTSETLNMSERLARREGVVHVRSRPDAALLVIGGESTGGPAGVTLTIDDRRIDEWTVAPGASFFKRIGLPPGALDGVSAFRRLVASYAGPDGRAGPLRLTQFALEPPQALFFVQHAGWHEIEYAREWQRRWRWTTRRADTFVNTGGRDVVLALSGESPLRYFDAAPRIVVRAGAQILGSASPTSDFDLEIRIPASALAASDGMLTIETDRTFVPHDLTGVADRRELGLRIFRFEIR